MTSEYKGSIATLHAVANQIAERFGDEAVKIYDPKVNCFTYRGWKERGFQVKRGEKALKSITFIEDKDLAGNVVRSYPKNCYLFFIEQVKPIKDVVKNDEEVSCQV